MFASWLQNTQCYRRQRLPIREFCLCDVSQLSEYDPVTVSPSSRVTCSAAPYHRSPRHDSPPSPDLTGRWQACVVFHKIFPFPQDVPLTLMRYSITYTPTNIDLRVSRSTNQQQTSQYTNKMCLPSKEAHARLLEMLSQKPNLSNTAIDTPPSSPGKTTRRTGNEGEKTQLLCARCRTGIAVDDHSMVLSY